MNGRKCNAQYGGMVLPCQLVKSLCYCSLHNFNQQMSSASCHWGGAFSKGTLLYLLGSNMYTLSTNMYL